MCFQLTSMRDLELLHPAHAEFVICDYTIENRLHYRRDVTLGEDASQVRSHGAPEVVAALNGGILALMDFHGCEKRCQANETFLRTTARSSTIIARQALEGKRVHSKLDESCFREEDEMFVRLEQYFQRIHFVGKPCPTLHTT